MTPRVGDRVTTESGEVGIVCYLVPPILRLETFHCYVLFDPIKVTIVTPNANPTEQPPRTNLLARIIEYIKNADNQDTPTGE